MDAETQTSIRDAFKAGCLRVRSATANGTVTTAVVRDVLRHNSAHKPNVRVVLEDGREVLVTQDHSLFTLVDGRPVAVQAGNLQSGSEAATVVGDRLYPVKVRQVVPEQSRFYMYDLSVPGPENFTLSDGILAHNSYSIGGISLDLDKASKYEGAAQSASDQFDKMIEKAKMTVKIIKGLQQPRYGTGIRSSFGPYTGAGVLTPAKFVGFVFPILLTIKTIFDCCQGWC